MFKTKKRSFFSFLIAVLAIFVAFTFTACKNNEGTNNNPDDIYSIQNVYGFAINEYGHLLVEFTDGTTTDLGKVTTDGKNGLSIGQVIYNYDNTKNEVHISFKDTEGNTIQIKNGLTQADYIVLKNGTDGENGAKGDKGDAGNGIVSTTIYQNCEINNYRVTFSDETSTIVSVPTTAEKDSTDPKKLILANDEFILFEKDIATCVFVSASENTIGTTLYKFTFTTQHQVFYIKVDNGKDGNAINEINKKGTAGLVDTYTITLSNGDTYNFTVTNGAKGDKGDTGNGIASFKQLFDHANCTRFNQYSIQFAGVSDIYLSYSTEYNLNKTTLNINEDKNYLTINIQHQYDNQTKTIIIPYETYGEIDKNDLRTACLSYLNNNDPDLIYAPLYETDITIDDNKYYYYSTNKSETISLSSSKSDFISLIVPLNYKVKSFDKINKTITIINKLNGNEKILASADADSILSLMEFINSNDDFKLYANTYIEEYNYLDSIKALIDNNDYQKIISDIKTIEDQLPSQNYQLTDNQISELNEYIGNLSQFKILSEIL